MYWDNSIVLIFFIELAIMDRKFVDFFCFLFIVLANVSVDSIKFGNEYSFEEIILIGEGSVKNVGYQIKGLLSLELLRKNLYLATLKDLNLLVYSTRVKNPYGFVPHTSNINHYNNDAFLIEVFGGEVKKIFISREEDEGIVKIKKAVSNLFQFQTSNYQGEESDLSGTCNVKYTTETPTLISKSKNDCIFRTSPASKIVWGGHLTSKRSAHIYHDNEIIVSITSSEEHTFAPYLNELFKANYSSEIKLHLTGSEILKEKFPSEDIQNIVLKIEAEQGEIFEIHDLTPEKSETLCLNCPKLGKIINENGEFLDEKYLGSVKSVIIFLEAVEAAKRSSSQEVYNVIKAKKNKKILPQLMDILGAAQTKNTHQAALKLLKINSENYDLNLCERYFLAISMTPRVQFHIIKELQQLVQNQHRNKKLWQTMVLTLAAVVNKYISVVKYSDELLSETIEFFENKIKDCTIDDECQLIYIKALSNIPHKKSIPLLLQIIENSTKKSGAKAMKVLSKIDSSEWDDNVIKTAERVLLSNINYDSSARIFALDILLRSELSYNRLCRTMSILKLQDKSRELKEYLLQRLAEISELNSSFKQLLKKVHFENGYNDYDILGQGGLSTTFTRFFMSNGSLSTSQEIVGGVLKQGNVNVNLLLNGEIDTPFILGIFAGGLSSFVSDDENIGDDDIATAGLELTVLGVELRPFVFFNGTGELMGHIWSGTASTLTSAFQALLLLEDTIYSVALATGETLDIKQEAAVSVDLSGKIEISLWNRNSKSLVLNRAGLLIKNNFGVNTPYSEADIKIDINVEPELHLLADLDFSKGASLCLRLQQPQTAVIYNGYKSLSIPGTSHKTVKSHHLTIPIPGKTYSLNAKNSEMCKKMFQM